MKKKGLWQQGMSFLEVVVAMFIVGIALAGSVAMIQAANRFGLNAEFKSIAQWQSQNMIDHMRANQFARDAYVFNNVSVDPALYTPQSGQFKALYEQQAASLRQEALSTPSCANGNACTPAEIARMERVFWLRQLQQELPQGVGLIGRVQQNNSTLPGSYAVIILWRSQADTESASAANSNQNDDVHGMIIPFSI